MVLKPQDVLILIKLWLVRKEKWTFNRVAVELFMSPSEVHAAVKRATQAQLFDEHLKRPRLNPLEEFLLHGVKYAFPPDLGTMTRGVPTAFATPDLLKSFAMDDKGEVYVWPYPEGEHRGISFSPLYKSVPRATLNDPSLYKLLGLLDAIRLGRAREQKKAQDMLHHALRNQDEKS
jgi:hypothetical protein